MKKFVFLTCLVITLSGYGQIKFSQLPRTDSLKGSTPPYVPDSALFATAVYNYATNYTTKAITYADFKVMLTAALHGVDTSYVSTLGDTMYGNLTVNGYFVNNNGLNFVYNEPISGFQNYAGAVHINGTELIGAGVMQKSTDTSAGLAYQNGGITRKIVTHRKYLQLYYDRTLSGFNEIAIRNDSIQVTMNGSEASYWDTVGNFQHRQHIYMLGTNRRIHFASTNTLVGGSAGAVLTGGLNNTFLGYQAGVADTSGEYNTFVGAYAGYTNHAASNNTYLGYRAGMFSVGSGNVFIGYSAGYNELGSNKLYIDNSTANYENALITGNFATDSLYVNGVLRTKDNADFAKNINLTDSLRLNNDSTFLIEDGSTLQITRKEWTSPNTAWLTMSDKEVLMGTFQNYYYLYDLASSSYGGASHVWGGNGKFSDSLILEGGFMRVGVSTDSNYIYTTAGGALYMKHKAGISNRGIFYMDDGESSFGTTNNSIYFEEGVTTEIDGNTTMLDSLSVNGSVNVLGNITARHIPKSGTVASAAEPTINTDLVDAYDITALATNITSFTTNLSGTPVNFQRLLIRIKDNATPRTITWGASFASGGVTLPVTTVTSKVLLVLLIYNSTTSKWVCWAADNEQ